MPVISVWNKCNNKCIMCTNNKEYSCGPSDQYTLKSQIKKMEKYLNGEKNVYVKDDDDSYVINLTGGEPTIHPDFIKFVSYLRLRCKESVINLLTNGRTFFNEEFLKQFIAAVKSPSGIIIPLHSDNAEEHDFISGAKGSFNQTVKALKNVFKYYPEKNYISIRFIQHGIGKDRLLRTLNFLLKEFPDTARYNVAVIHYEIEGESFTNEEQIHLSLSDSAKQIYAISDTIKKFKSINLYHFPLCVLHKSLRKIAAITLPADERVYPSQTCAQCAVKNKCLGLMIDYYKKFGFSELKTINK